jgi:hypothetical protein
MTTLDHPSKVSPDETVPYRLLRSVHGGVEDCENAPEDEHEGVDFPACSRFHFIHRRSGKALGHE